MAAKKSSEGKPGEAENPSPVATLEERQVSALELTALNSERIAIALERIADALPGTKPHTLPAFDPTPPPTLDG